MKVLLILFSVAAVIATIQTLIEHKPTKVDP
jgi:hypothetical protein